MISAFHLQLFITTAPFHCRPHRLTTAVRSAGQSCRVRKRKKEHKIAVASSSSSSGEAASDRAEGFGGQGGAIMAGEREPSGCLVCEKLKGVWTMKNLVGLLLGQFVSLLVTSTGFSSSELAMRGINAPTSQSLLNYLLLAIVYGGVMLYRKQRLQVPWYYYMLLAVVDVEANYLVVKSYQFTSFTSVMLLDCWTIPCVILLTWLLLKTKYGIRKFLGVGICVAGLVMVVFSDVHAGDRRTGGSNPMKGDMLVLAGSMLYAITNVSEEFFMKGRGDRTELMAMLGAFGVVVSAIQIIILERNQLTNIHWTTGAVLPYIGFASAMFGFYSTVPVILKICGSTLLNLSLLTSDMWAVLIRIFAYHEKVDWMYFIAFAGVVVGLVIYSFGNKDVETVRVETTSYETDEEAARSNSSHVTTIGVGNLTSEDAKE